MQLFAWNFFYFFHLAYMNAMVIITINLLFVINICPKLFNKPTIYKIHLRDLFLPCLNSLNLKKKKKKKKD